jgi:hypothetical protein
VGDIFLSFFINSLSTPFDTKSKYRQPCKFAIPRLPPFRTGFNPLYTKGPLILEHFDSQSTIDDGLVKSHDQSLWVALEMGLNPASDRLVRVDPEFELGHEIK